MALHSALRGHGLFVYDANATLKAYGDTGGKPSELALAFKEMGCTHAWIRLFGVKGNVSEKPTQQLVDALRREAIAIAGWGYCFGKDWQDDLQRTINQCKKFGLEAFVADIEPGNKTSAGMTKWSPSDFDKYITGANDEFGPDNLGVSTWPLPIIHQDYLAVDLVEIGAPKVGLFAPQAYWMNFPKKIHYAVTGYKEKNYPKDDPISFVRLVRDHWRDMKITNPLVITGQAYWGEGGPKKSTIEKKISTFVTSFSEWDTIVGLNWWHAGGSADAMSNDMIATLTAAKLDQKPFGDPDAFPRPEKRIPHLSRKVKKSSKETSFNELVGIPVHYDRNPPKYGYGSKGEPYTFDCRFLLLDTLEKCLTDLFNIWNRPKPTIILSAGTIGDGDKEHGKGLAFDLDGFYWDDKKFMMDSYPSDRLFYIGINAHLFLYFSQVLSYHYPLHHDHFHVDFNFSMRFRPESNAQTFFVQAALKYLYGQELGKSGIEKDGVDGNYGSTTHAAAKTVLRQLGLGKKADLKTPSIWRDFLSACRSEGFKTVVIAHSRAARFFDQGNMPLRPGKRRNAGK